MKYVTIKMDTFLFIGWTSLTAKAQIPLHGPDRTLLETRVYNQVSDKVRLGPLGFIVA